MSRFRLWAAGTLAAVVALLATAVPASAHDQLISSSPEEGAKLTTAPESVSLEFSDELLTMGDAGTTVIVVDGDGRDWATGTPVVDENVVTLALSPGMPEAGYEVRWQVVSSDGHPISGAVPFTVGDAEPLAAADPQGGDGGIARTQERSQDQAAQEHQGVPRVALVGAGGAAVAAVLFALVQFFRRRGARRDDIGGPAD